MKRVFIGLAVVLATSAVHAKEIEAAFGFTWGNSKVQVMSKGVSFDECSDKGELEICSTKKAIKSISFGEFYLLAFHQKRGLVKVSMVGETITDDITGSEGKAVYARVKGSLRNKYGASEASELVGAKLFDAYDEFYQCLAYSGCGAWVAFWEGDSGGAVVVEIKGISRGKGYLRITYESKEWKATIDGIKSKKQAKDDDAL